MKNKQIPHEALADTVEKTSESFVSGNSLLIQKRKNNLLLLLSGIFITNAIVAEIIGVKIFSLEKSLSLPPAGLKLFADFILDFNLTSGAVIWPVIFLTTDIINEYFGKSGVKKISFLATGLIIYVFAVLSVTIWLEPAEFWIQIHRGEDNFNINFAFSKIFGQGTNIIIGSVTAFLISQLLDAYLFQYIRKKTNGKLIWLRATGSTVISQILDSFLVLFLAFYLLPEEGKWPLALVFSVGIINYMVKLSLAIVLTPLIYLAHSLIDGYLYLNKP
ncbi:MAG: queuosine precursor transporter [Cytophagaceae bacterium]